MKTEMRMQTVQRAKRLYIADDGREFTEFNECLDWEVNMYLRQLKDSKDIIECNELLGYYPFNITHLTRREQEIPHFYKWWDELR